MYRVRLAAALALLLIFIQPGWIQRVWAAEPEKQYSPAELRADFTAMYQGLKSGAFDLFAFTPQPVMDTAFRRELKRLDRPMTKLEAEIRFEAFAALAHQGHARVDAPYAAWEARRAAGGRAFPLAIRVADGRVYVARNASGLGEIAPGDELLAMNGQSMPAWLQRAERHVSAETPRMAHSLMEYDFPVYVWIELGDPDGFDIRLRKPDGRVLALRLPARTRAEMTAAAAKAPPSLNLDEPLRESRVLDGGVGYLRPGPFYNAEAKTGAEEWDVSGFSAFVDAAFGKFQAAGVDRIIIDLRGNPGGDNLFSDPMIAWFADRPFRFFSEFKVKVSPESTRSNADRIANDAEAAGPVSRQYAGMYAHARDGEVVDFVMPMAQPRQGGRFKGKVFLLIDRQSYSNSVSVAALVQDYHFATVIGEETSDVAAAYGAMEQFTLPATGIKVGYPKAHIIRASGDRTVRGVVPDIAIRIPVVQTPADEVLQQAVRIARTAR